MDTPFVGSLATYHGSNTAAHGDGYLIAPDAPGPDGEARYRLGRPGADRELRRVRRSSFTVQPTDWPEGAVPVEIAGHWYMGAWAEPGGSRYARVIRFHYAGCVLGEWCRFREVTPEIRELDSLRPAP